MYEDIYQALNQSIVETGTSRKKLALTIYPGTPVATAQSKFTRAMNPENGDVHLSAEMILTIMEETRSEDVIYFLCDRFGFKRPERKPAALESQLLEKLGSMQKQMTTMMEELQRVREGKIDGERREATGGDKDRKGGPLQQEQKDVDAVRDKIAGGLKGRTK